MGGAKGGGGLGVVALIVGGVALLKQAVGLLGQRRRLALLRFRLLRCALRLRRRHRSILTVSLLLPLLPSERPHAELLSIH